LGSQLTGQQIYQYRLIFPYETGTVVNLGTNIDCSSVEGEVKYSLTPTVPSKLNFALTPEANQLQVEAEIPTESNISVLQVTVAPEPQFNFSFMQAICPWLTLGGILGYSHKSGDVTRSIGGIMSYGDNSLFFQKDNNVSGCFDSLIFLRKYLFCSTLSGGNGSRGYHSRYIFAILCIVLCYYILISMHNGV
jgi:hypothetical protein